MANRYVVYDDCLNPSRCKGYVTIDSLRASGLSVGCQRNWTLLRPREPKRLGVVEAPSEG